MYENCKRVVLAFGTRPEAIKMAPIYHALSKIAGIEPVIFLTGQHKEQLAHAMTFFNLPIHANLEVMTQRQRLPELAARILSPAAEKLKELEVDYLLVHGDTLTTFALAWVSFLERIPVGHVEAGLRSNNMAEPFPEEANRRLTDILSDLDLAPTKLARKNLIGEGKPPDKIVVTGQTGIDAILYAAKVDVTGLDLPPGRCISVTIHRRENWPVLANLAGALAKVARRHPDCTFVYPVHMNPTVRESVWPVLAGVENFILLDPLEYGAMAALLKRSSLIITDSGGLQEEGAALHVPVVVLRNVTERPEGVDAGGGKLAGTDPNTVYSLIDRLLDDPVDLDRMKSALNPYGDGNASQRIAKAVAWRLGLGKRPGDWQK